MVDYSDLVLIGRAHQQSILLHEHDQWNECPELGVIGDMLTSDVFMTKTSVLVVQQQRMEGKFIKHNVKPNQRDQLEHKVPMSESPIPSCNVSVDKYDKG